MRGSLGDFAPQKWKKHVKSIYVYIMCPCVCIFFTAPIQSPEVRRMGYFVTAILNHPN